jgi:hypothetical protein
MLDQLIPDYAKTTEKPGIVGTQCLQYRHNGLTGGFFRGTESLGNELVIRPIEYRWILDKRSGTKAEYWFDVAFIDDRNCLSAISFRKVSAVNVFSGIQSLAVLGIRLECVSLALISKLVDVALIDDAGCYEDSYSAVTCADSGFVTEQQLEQYHEWHDALTEGFDWNIAGEVQ